MSKCPSLTIQNKHEITIPKRTALDAIQHVTKVLEIDASEPQPAGPTPLKVTTAEVSSVPLSAPPTECWLPPVILTHLDTKQQKVVEEVI